MYICKLGAIYNFFPLLLFAIFLSVGTKVAGASGRTERCYFHIKRINVVRDPRRNIRVAYTQIYVPPPPPSRPSVIYKRFKFEGSLYWQYFNLPDIEIKR